MFHFVFIASILCAVNVQADCTQVFAHKKNPDLYWQALLEVAHGNKEAALKTVAGINNSQAITRALPWKDPQSDIDAFFDKLFLDSVSCDPQMLSQIRLFESIGIYDHNIQLTNVSPKAYLQNLCKAQENLACLNRYNYESLSRDQKIAYKIFSWMLHQAVAGEKFLFHAYKINQLDGVLIDLVDLFIRYHKLETAQDAERYITRLSKIPQHFQQAIEFLEVQKDKGLLPPRFTIEKVILSIKKIVAECTDKNIFYTYLKEQLDTINVKNRRTILKKARRVIEHDVCPAYQMLQRYFTHLLDRVHTNNGVWALPDGDEYYRYMLKCHTTTTLSADAIHAIGLQHVAQIHQEIRKLLASEKLDDKNKSVGALMREFSENPRFYYPNTDAGREECLVDFRVIFERSKKDLGYLFGLKPQAGLVIQRFPVQEEDGAPSANNLMPSIDGSRPGVVLLNLRNMAEVPKFDMETLIIHEGDPGHHFQSALQCQIDIPILLKIALFNGYCEGWALYAEKLAYEYDFYSSLSSKLGHLQNDLLRAARLVVDTGIHHKRWTREQAIVYMENVTGIHHDSVVTEVERYFVLPGQACSYKIGQLKILELRKRAQQKLGDTFDIREFHDVVLKIAAAPLTILEEVVDRYINERIKKGCSV